MYGISHFGNDKLYLANGIPKFPSPHRLPILSKLWWLDTTNVGRLLKNHAAPQKRDPSQPEKNGIVMEKCIPKNIVELQLTKLVG